MKYKLLKAVVSIQRGKGEDAMKYVRANVKFIDLGEEEILTCKSGCNTICSDYEVGGSGGGQGGGQGGQGGFGGGTIGGGMPHMPWCGWAFKMFFG